MLEKSRSTNSAIAKAMADVRSSSALLAEIRQLVPESIALDRFKVKDNVLEISGSAQQPNGLRLVNALLLRLSASGFFAPEHVELLNRFGRKSRTPCAPVQPQCGFCGRCCSGYTHFTPAPWGGGDGTPNGGFGAGGFDEVITFCLKKIVPPLPG